MGRNDVHFIGFSEEVRTMYRCDIGSKFLGEVHGIRFFLVLHEGAFPLPEETDSK